MLSRTKTVATAVVLIALFAFAGWRHLHSTGAAFTPAQQTASGGKSAQASGSAAKGGGVVSVTAAPATAGSLPVLRDTFGSIVPLASTALSSQEAGIVAAIMVKDGQSVKAGDIILQLEDRAIRAELVKDSAVLAKDQATLQDAMTNLERTRALIARGAATIQAGDDAEAAIHVPQAAIRVDLAQIAADQVTLANRLIKAPFDGRLGAVLVSPGAFVSAGTPVVTLTQMTPVYAQFTLTEVDLPAALRAIDRAALVVSGGPTGAGQSDVVLNSPVVFIDNQVDMASGTVQMRALLANDDGAFWPGQSLSLHVKLADVDDLVLVPGVAVQPQSDGSVVYVVAADNTIDVRKVTVALRAGDQAGISDGLTAGEMVVTEGHGALSKGTKVVIVAPGAAASGLESTNTTGTAMMGSLKTVSP